MLQRLVLLARWIAAFQFIQGLYSGVGVVFGPFEEPCIATVTNERVVLKAKVCELR